MTDWNKKLDAYLHDPPEKVLDLAWHKKRAENYESGLGLEDTEFDRTCDHTAAAADRLPWPRWQFLESAFDGSVNFFKHPLGGKMPDGQAVGFRIKRFATADLAHQRAWDQRPRLSHGNDLAQFLAFWRFFRWWASDQRDSRLAFLPADTRLPDHTIWVHNSIVSALQSCVTGEGKDARCRPAFLLFQIGPVQDYIAQARRTLDLWSGSYLLSYLIGCGLRHIALNYGPDNVIFPNLCGQPIFDLLLKEKVWDQAGTSKYKTLWECFGYEKTNGGQLNDYGRRRLLTPSLPNRFLAVLPADKAAEIARDVAQAIRDTHKAIAGKVWEWASKELAPAGCWTDEKKRRFDAQNERFLDITWQVVPWPEKADGALPLTAFLPKDENTEPQAGLDTILELARRMEKNQRDVRNFDCERFAVGPTKGRKDESKLQPDAKLDNPGVAWSALYQLPGMPETFNAVKAAILHAKDAGQTPVVNFTGGTKLMSIGAFVAALKPEHTATSLYVDTEDETFVDGRTTGGLDGVLEGDFSFTPLRRMLNVNVIAVANGRQRVTGGRDWQPYLPLARHLLEFATEEAATWEAVHGGRGLCPNGREPRRALEWLALLDKPIVLPPVVGEMAVEARLVCTRDGASYLPETTRAQLQDLAKQERATLPDYIAAVKPLQFSLNFLSGSWWEAIVADAAGRSGQFRDLRWSVNIGERGGGFDPEEDVIGVDGVQIAYFSCKRGGAKSRLVSYLDELSNRARSIGGNFTRRFLAVYQSPVGQNAANLQKRAKELNGIQIITPRDLENPEIFARRLR